jgi:hypothetical protein
MSYSAKSEGFIDFSDVLNVEDGEALKKDLEDVFEYVFSSYYGVDEKGNRKEKTCVYLYSNDEYDWEDCQDALEATLKYGVEKGHVEFCGEDDELWRFIFKDNRWIEESGKVVYESEEKHFAVVTHHSFDKEVSVKLFTSEKFATACLQTEVERERKIREEERVENVDLLIEHDDDWSWASLTARSSLGDATMEWKVVEIQEMF